MCFSPKQVYHYGSIEKEAIMYNVQRSETVMILKRLIGATNTDDGIIVKLRWRGLTVSEETLEPLAQIYEDIPQPLHKLIRWKKIQNLETQGDEEPNLS